MPFTLEAIVAESAPPWVDWVLVVFVWMAALMQGYLGAMRVSQSHGVFLILLRISSLGWFCYAVRLTWWMVQYGDLPNSWWTLAPLLAIATGAAGLGVERVLVGRMSYRHRRRKGD